MSSWPGRVWGILLVALGYFLLAQGALYLTGAPETAATFWPAAAFALWVLLGGHRRLALGLWLGAFGSDLLYRAALVEPAAGVLMAGMIATGSVLQALVGAWVLRWQLARHPRFEFSMRSAAILLGLCGPIVCAISASAGTLALVLWQTQPALALPIWVRWWAGDSLGVLFVLPLLLLLLPKVRREWAGPLMPLVTSFVLVAAVLLGGFAAIAGWERAQRTAALDEESDVLQAMVTRQLARATADIQGVARFAQAVGASSLDAVAEYVEPLIKRAEFAGVGWAPRVTQVQREAFEARLLLADGCEDGIWERNERGARIASPVREAYFPVERVFGRITVACQTLDAEVATSRAMQNAIALKGPAWAKRDAFFSNDQQRDDKWAVLVPVHPASTPAGQATGFVVGFLYLDTLLAESLQRAKQDGVDVQISRVDASGERQVFVDQRSAGSRARAADYTDEREGFGGARWAVALWSQRSSELGVQQTLYLAGVVFFALLAVVFVLALFVEHHRMRREIREQSRAVQAGQTLLENVLDASGAGYWDWDLTTDIVARSRYWFDLFGYDREQFSMHLTFWRAHLHPDDRERVEAALAAHLRGDTSRYLVEYRQRTAKGEWLWVRGHGAIRERDAEGKPLHMSGVTIDIHERKLAELALQDALANVAAKEEENRSVLEHLAECVVTSDERGVIRSANQAVEKIFGWRVEEVIGQNVSILMPTRLRARHDTEIADYLTTGKRGIIGIGRTVEGRHRDGTVIPIEIALSEYFVDGRRYFTGIMRDIRERLRITAELEAARQEAEEASRAKSAFLAMMSHEIRTPMNGVIGMIDVLGQSSLRGQQIEMVEIIRESAFSLLGIIEDILDFSKIEAGRMELDRAPVRIAQVVESVCAMLDSLASRKGVDFTVFIDPALPVEVVGDAVRLRQIVVNLANNAIKFSSREERRGRVAVRLEVLEREGERIVVMLSVSDNGIGMDAATQARLFSQFMQATAGTTRTYGGTGLGLHITHHLTALMGGDIHVQSAPGEGATFTVRLPLEISPTTPDATDVDLLAGVRCVVPTIANSVCADWAAYLRAAGAEVEQVPVELVALDQALTTPAAGPVAVVVDASVCALDVEALRQLASRAPVEVRIVLIARGQRRRPRFDAELTMVDGNMLCRKTLLETVAQAVGRLCAVPDATNRSVQGVMPSRAEAIGRGRLILVVEDNTTNQKVIVQQLALLGFAADVAANGRVALERWRAGQYALILTDLNMPELDGYDLAREVRAGESAGARIPIIALSANVEREEAQRCAESGMDDYLSKPTRLDRLRTTLERWLPADGVAKSAPTAAAALAPQPAARPVTPSASQVAVDLSVLAAMIGDEPAMLTEFLDAFVSSARVDVTALCAACSEGELARAVPLAHKIKSAARTVGALRLGELCDNVEHAMPDDAEALRARGVEIAELFDAVVAYAAGRHNGRS